MTDPVATARRETFVRSRCGAAVLVCVVLALAGLWGRLYYVQTQLRGKLLALSDEQRRLSSVFPARRGMILDRRGRVVAVSEQTPDVFVDPGLVEDLDALAGELAPRINQSPEEIKRRISDRADKRYVVVAEGVDEIAAEAVRELRPKFGNALGLTERSTRRYPLGESMAHVIGWVGRDGKGMEGLELLLNKHLAGTDGMRRSIADARRRAVGRPDGADLMDGDVLERPVDGGHAVLTIDAELQRIVEESLGEAVRDVEAESGIGILMDPFNGEILAMACWPTFDPEDAPSVPALRRRNRAITDPVEPGSTFKPFIATGALEGGFVSPTERIDCKNGQHYFGKRLIKDTKPRGVLDLSGIIAKSSNIGMGFIAERMGNAALRDTIVRFGFGQKTGIDFPGEDPGVVYPLKEWGPLSTQSVAIGYEVLVTPLQLARAFSAMVNGGVLVRPRLVRETVDSEGTIRQTDKAEVIRRAFREDTIRFMAKGPLRAVVTEGGGDKAEGDRYTVLGKTGTAKLMGESGHYAEGAYLGTFIGAAPAGDPKLVALAMIRRPNPRKAYYGGSVAAPAIAEIFDRSLAYLGVPPDKHEERSAVVASYSQN